MIYFFTGLLPYHQICILSQKFDANFYIFSIKCYENSPIKLKFTLTILFPPTKRTYFLFMTSIFQIIFVNDEYCGVVLEHVWFEHVLASWETTLCTEKSHTRMYISSILICIYDTLSNSTYVRDINEGGKIWYKRSQNRIMKKLQINVTKNW